MPSESEKVMADENTNIPPAGNAAELPPVDADTSPSLTPADIAPSITPADAAPSITPADFNPSITAAEEGGTAPEATPPAPTGAKKYEELHSEPHPHVRWHADVLADGHVYHGLIKDVSMQGANLFLEHNLQNTRLIKLHIHVPPLLATSPPHVLDLSAKIISTIYDGGENSFRSGIIFQKFALESDQAYLQSRIG